MRASDGAYYPGLDHVRALAAFLVFGWHFTHGANGSPAPFGPSALPIFGPFNEGHCGVALFMCLSGYLFAKILDGKEVIWPRFYWNRAVRLFPLLSLSVAIGCLLRWGFHTWTVHRYIDQMALGIFEPQRWGVGWSIAIEIQFYAILPLVIALRRRWRASLFLFPVVGFVIRGAIYGFGGDVETYAYWTLVGCIDQFLLGMAAWEYRTSLRSRHVIMLLSAVVFFSFYQWFAEMGGFYGTQGPALVWVVLPTINAAFFSFLVAYYDGSFVFPRRWYWRAIEAAGTASYSIYLLHVFFVFRLAPRLMRFLPGMRTWEISEFVALIVFVAFVPVAWLSYALLEKPIMDALRVRYTIRRGQEAAVVRLAYR